jgi:hypothetical protein
MLAIEFETTIDGEFIRIPHLEQLNTKHVKVILLYREAEEPPKPKLPPIFYMPVRRNQYEPFNRENLYNE